MLFCAMLATLDAPPPMFTTRTLPAPRPASICAMFCLALAFFLAALLMPACGGGMQH
jgi:hypothetical protein